MDKAFSSADNGPVKHNKKTSKTNHEQTQAQFANSLEAAKLRASPKPPNYKCSAPANAINYKTSYSCWSRNS